MPNVVRSADDFASGAADMFFFAFGAPKVREVDATVGGIRVLSIDEKGMPAARKIMPYGYLTEVKPGPVFIGVEKPMKVYSFDAIIFTNAKTSDDFVYKFLKALDKDKKEIVAIQPVLREFTLQFAYKDYDIPYHPGALKYFKEHKVEAVGPVTERCSQTTRRSQSPPHRHPSPARPTFCKRCCSSAWSAGCSTCRADPGHLVLYRTIAGGVPRARARAVLHRRQAAQGGAVRMERRHHLGDDRRLSHLGI